LPRPLTGSREGYKNVVVCDLVYIFVAVAAAACQRFTSPYFFCPQTFTFVVRGQGRAGTAVAKDSVTKVGFHGPIVGTDECRVMATALTVQERNQ
jgi:phage tail tape-measure protein